MGLHTSYLGHAKIEPPLSEREVEFLRCFNRTRHCGPADDPFSVAEHPDDQAEPGPTGVEALNTPARDMPGLWCPWTCCATGCCLLWDGAEKPYAPDRWLRFVIDVLLSAGSPCATDPRAAVWELTFDHVLDGVLVGERRETGELFALHVRGNRVRRSVLVPGAAGTDEWGYRDPVVEREDRARRVEARRLRFERAVADDLASRGDLDLVGGEA